MASSEKIALVSLLKARSVMATSWSPQDSSTALTALLPFTITVPKSTGAGTTRMHGPPWFARSSRWSPSPLVALYPGSFDVRMSVATALSGPEARY